MVGPLGEVVPLFRPASRKRGEDGTTTLRRRDVGAEKGLLVYSLKPKFFSRFKALRSMVSASWGPSKNPSPNCTKLSSDPFLSFASLRWFPFLCDTLKKAWKYITKVSAEKSLNVSLPLAPGSAHPLQLNNKTYNSKSGKITVFFKCKVGF